MRPIDTPRAVTIPGQWRDSSIVGIMLIAGSDRRPSPSSSGAVMPCFSRSMRLAKLALDAWSMPKVANILRSTSYGGRPSCSYSSMSGTISVSMNRRTASRII